MKRSTAILAIFTSIFFVTTNSIAANPMSVDNKPLILAAGFGDIFNSVTNGVKGAFDTVTSKLPNQSEDDPVGGLEPPAAGYQPLTREDKREVQMQLARLGYEPGPADGIVGKGTRSAISAYQADNGMTVTGEPSPQLLAHIKSSSRTSSNRAGPESIVITLSPSMRARDRQLAYECADKINRERRRENIAEISLVRGESAQSKSTNGAATNAVLGVAGDIAFGLFASPEARYAAQYAKLGQAAATQAANQNAIAKIPEQTAAQQELQYCISEKQAAKYREEYDDY